MGIETWNLRMEHNPAWMAVERLKSYLASEFGLHPNTVKSFLSPEQIIPATALAGVTPKTQIHWEKLTPWEISVLRDPSLNLSEIKKIALVDVDGVINNIFSPSDWIYSPTLTELGQRVDRMIICTHRMSISEKQLPWQLISKLTLNPQRLSYTFPFLTIQRVIELEEKLSPEKTKVILGSKWLNNRASREVLEQIDLFRQFSDDPYLVYVGSGLSDILLFARIVNYLRKTEQPFDRAVFCINGHLIQ